MLEIDKDIILKAADRCEKQFACLSGRQACQRNDKHQCCTVKKAVGKTVLFLHEAENKYCRNKMDFGYSPICACPVRREIYNKYNV
jgi:hypothetical protein